MQLRKPKSSARFSRLRKVSRTRIVLGVLGLAALLLFALEVYALSKYESSRAAAAAQPSPPAPPKMPTLGANALGELVEARRAPDPPNPEPPAWAQRVNDHDAPAQPAAAAADAAAAAKQPNLALLMERIRAALHPFTKRYTAKHPYSRLAPEGAACGEKWSSERDKMFLSGCPEPEGCQQFDSLAAAKQACSAMGVKCGGVTREDDAVFQVRQGSVPAASPNNDASWIKVPDPCDESKRRDADAEPSARNVWEAFHLAMDAALQDESLNLQTLLGPVREDGTIFVSIASYRDFTCRDTLRRAFERADRPERISAGIIQQNCVSKTGCMTGTGWAETRRWVESKTPDPDCAAEFCASALGKPHCEAGRVRILRLDEIDSLGPFFTRFLNSKLWRGENYYLQIDAHTDFRSGWDSSLAAQMKATATYPFSVISNYPPGGTPTSQNAWPALRHPTTPDDAYAPSALCACSFETAGAGRITVRLGQSSRRIVGDLGTPRKSCFVAAGFFIAHGSIVDNVGFDPFLPYLFMGEELALSARFYTAGYDVYAPSVDVLQHEYVRKESPKFWETVGHVYSNGGLHNDLTDLVVQRVQFLDAFPEADDPTKLDPPSLYLRMDQFGLGTKRSAAQFNQRVGMDLVQKVQRAPQWCTKGLEGVSVHEERLDFDLMH